MPSISPRKPSIPKQKTPVSEPCTCPIASASDLIGDVWVILIVRELLSGPKRFTELREALIPSGSSTPINTRTLTSRLKSLERDRVITRKEFAHEMPPKVEYTLTEKGTALSNILDQLREYGKKYM